MAPATPVTFTIVLREVHVAGPTPNFLFLRARIILRARAFLLLVALQGTVVLQSCTIEVAAPPETGFIAVILTAQGAALLPAGQRYVLRIQELSGSYPINDRFRVAPNDTVIRTYPLASYIITVDSVPISCTSRSGNAQQALISSPGNTSITRFNFVCDALLGLTVLADGYQVDSSFVWTATGPGGTQKFGVVGPADTVRIDDVIKGAYTVELGHIAPHCIVTSDGRRRQTVNVDPPATSAVHFRLRCSNLARTPKVIHFASSIRNGVSGFYAEVVETDPDDYLGSYAWDLTDCLGNPLYRNAGYIADALRYERTANTDTARIVVMVPVPDPNADLERACTSVRFQDLEGNTTFWWEERNRNESGRVPVITRFNVFIDGGHLRTQLEVTDPDNDLAGAFMTIAFRDGSQGTTPNGRPDIRAYNVAGYLPPFRDIPLVPADGSRFQMADVLSVIVDVIDRNGNITRAVDANFSQ